MFNDFRRAGVGGGNSPLRGSRGEIKDLRPAIACERPAFAPLLRRGNFMLASAARTGANRPHSLRSTRLCLTLCPPDSAPDCLRARSPSRRSPGATFCRQRVRQRLRAGATVPGELNPRKFNFGSADGWHEGCEPGSHTRAIIYKAAPRSCRRRDTSAPGPRRLPRTPLRPTARFIVYNSVSCVHRLRRCHADCFPPSPAARGRPPRGSHRANLQASFTPAVRAAVLKVSAGKNDLCFRFVAKIRYRQLGDAAMKQSIDHILEYFRDEALNNRDLGDKFERLIAGFLTKDPLLRRLFSDSLALDGMAGTRQEDGYRH